MPPTAISRANTEINFKNVCFIFFSFLISEISAFFLDYCRCAGIIAGLESENLSVLPENLWPFLGDMITPTVSTFYEFDNFRIDSGKRLLLNGGGEAISLTPKIFDTLLYLVSHYGTVVDKDELMSAIWPDTIVEENNLNKNISVLRRVLGEHPGEHRYIVTVPGIGYKFVADVRAITVEKVPETSNNGGRTEALSEPRRKRWPSKKSAFAAAGVIAAIAIAVFAFGYSYFNNQRQIDSIAVMPFVNDSGNPELEYLSDGMTETLIERLSKLPDLHVKARSSVFRYKGKNTDAKTIGKELNARAVLYGWVVQRGEDLVLRVELVDAQTENNLWVQTYNKKLSNLIALQGEVARDLVRELSLKPSGADKQKLAKNYTENVEAYQLFLNGRFHHRKLTPPEIKKGIAYLQQAIDTDPSYALAYTEISRAYTALALAGDMNPGEVLLKAKAAAQRAVEIDDALAEAHSSLGSVFFWYDWNWKEAEEHFIRALELDPNSSIAHFGYADFLSKMGRPEEALAEIKRAREIDPLSPFINTFEAWFLNGAGQPDAALDRVQSAIDLDPNFYFAYWMKAEIHRGKKMYPESIDESRQAKALAPNQTWSDAGLAYTFAETGQVDESRAILNEMLRLSESRWVPPYHIALVYNALGETNQALAWLEKGYKHHDPKMALLKEERWNNLRGDPRFQDILRRVGF
jgi:TolB-like protein/DNA-binding winged helix-turn-helix (wHTH) protein/Tfp pilus assembly protein PilF